MEHDPVLDALGPRLRALRKQRGVTLAGLSAATGISASTLSRLESGRRKPTLEFLLLLARVHQVPLDELVGMPAPGDPRVRARPLRRNGRTFIPLTRRPGGVQAYKMLVPSAEHEADQQSHEADQQSHEADQQSHEADQQSHEGYEWMYVLSGRLRLRLGPLDLVLKPGEAAEVDTRTPPRS